MPAWGFNRDNITSNNLFIPIAYYIKHMGLPTNFAASPKNAENVRKIKKWFVSAMLKRVFSSQPDGVLRLFGKLFKKMTKLTFLLRKLLTDLRVQTEPMSLRMQILKTCCSKNLDKGILWL